MGNTSIRARATRSKSWPLGSDNYAAFFRLHRRTPNDGNKILDLLNQTARRSAEVMVKPTSPRRFRCRSSRAFREDESEKVPTNFCKVLGLVLVGDGDSTIDTKKSAGKPSASMWRRGLEWRGYIFNTVGDNSTPILLMAGNLDGIITYCRLLPGRKELLVLSLEVAEAGLFDGVRQFDDDGMIG